MEKSGAMLLTPEELAAIKSGKLPGRIAELWNVGYTEAKQMVDQGHYTVEVKDVNDSQE